VQQQIREMTARGEPLAPLAAATNSLETAQLIALQSLVLAGKVDVMEAAPNNVAASGGDTGLLDRIGGPASSASSRQVVPLAPNVPLGDAPEDDEDDPNPTGRYNAKRLTARLEATR
jgi:hypothetical protein